MKLEQIVKKESTGKKILNGINYCIDVAFQYGFAGGVGAVVGVATMGVFSKSIVPISIGAGIGATMGIFYAYSFRNYTDTNEYYYGGAGWGWIDENGKAHKGDNR